MLIDDDYVSRAFFLRGYFKPKSEKFENINRFCAYSYKAVFKQFPKNFIAIQKKKIIVNESVYDDEDIEEVKENNE